MIGRVLRLGGRDSRIWARVAPGLLLLMVSASAQANTFVVTTTADGNNGACTVPLCTLRDAVIAANANGGPDTITLPAGTYNLTITGTGENAAATGDLDIASGGLTINGASAATTIIDGGAIDRVIHILGGPVAINDVTIRNGRIAGGGGIFVESATAVVTLTQVVVTGNNGLTAGGGGIRNGGILTLIGTTVSNNNTTTGQGAGIFATSVTITDSTISNNISTGDQGGGLFLINGASTITSSTISGNQAFDEGGGIFLNGSTDINNPAVLTITNSTISNNTLTQASSSGGGLTILSQATVTIVSSTIASNSAATNGGNLQNLGASVTLKNTIVSNPVSGTNCDGTITNGGGNLQFPGTTCGVAITTGDPLLQALAGNGGRTQTRSLSAGSPAINSASGCPPPATDQRSILRPQGSACEIGAFECQTGECGAVVATATPTQPGATATPTNTPTTVAGTPTRTPTQISGVVVPTLTPPMLVLLGLALAGAALMFLKRSA
jgi:CSLREA domain-containing protein